MKRKMYEINEEIKRIRILGRKYFTIKFRKYYDIQNGKEKTRGKYLLILFPILFLGIILY